MLAKVARPGWQAVGASICLTLASKDYVDICAMGPRLCWFSASSGQDGDPVNITSEEMLEVAAQLIAAAPIFSR